MYFVVFTWFWNLKCSIYVELQIQIRGFSVGYRIFMKMCHAGNGFSNKRSGQFQSIFRPSIALYSLAIHAQSLPFFFSTGGFEMTPKAKTWKNHTGIKVVNSIAFSYLQPVTQNVNRFFLNRRIWRQNTDTFYVVAKMWYNFSFHKINFLLFDS